MRIIWLDEAERDLDRIAEYILKDDPAAALRLIYTIREATRENELIFVDSKARSGGSG